MKLLEEKKPANPENGEVGVLSIPLLWLLFLPLECLVGEILHSCL